MDNDTAAADCEPEPELEETGDEVELLAEVLDHEAQGRLWLRAITPLLQLRSHESDPSGRVQLAFDLMHIAACDRARRILRGDLPPERG
jgi:hypothetical protein